MKKSRERFNSSQSDALGRVRLTFNCRIVLIHEVALDQLDRQARLSDATTADDHQLIFS
jgi:hypothetical protein